MEHAVYQRMAQLEAKHWWFRARATILEQLLASQPLPAHARLLEVGSGTGANLKLLAALGDVVAMEPDSTARALCQQHHGIEAIPGTLPNGVDLAPASFDLIAAIDVIEHVKEDRASLETLLGLLKPGGRLILTVPAFPFLWSGHDEEHHHQRRYRRRPLINMLTEAGFEVRYSSYYNCLLFPLVAMIRIAKNLLPGDNHPDDTMPQPWLNNILYRAFASECRWVAKNRRLPFGVSLIAVATRPEQHS